MTDNEIIKALSICSNENGICSECPYSDDYTNCNTRIAKDAIDLINRLQAEKSNLEIELKAMRGAANSYKAEIERLKECPKCVYEYDGEITEYCVQGPCPNYKTEAQIKAEAYKEFAERLREHKFEIEDIPKKEIFYAVETHHIDNLLKEMAGEG